MEGFAAAKPFAAHSLPFQKPRVNRAFRRIGTKVIFDHTDIAPNFYYRFLTKSMSTMRKAKIVAAMSGKVM